MAKIWKPVVVLALVALVIIFVSFWIYNKDLRYGTIYSYNGFEEETHLLKFAGYPEISPDDLIFEEWFETRYGELIAQSKFIEIWDKKSDAVGIAGSGSSATTASKSPRVTILAGIGWDKPERVVMGDG